MPEHSFSKAYERLAIARHEFRHFKFLAKPKIGEICASIPRFDDLERAFSFYVDDKDEDRLQLWFGQRSMFRKDHEGKVAAEGGLALVYSLGPSGDVAVIMYPAKSSLAAPFEDHIYLGLGSFTGYELFRRLPSDLRTLVAYGHVTSLDGNPTRGERLRIWWQRLCQPMQVEGKFAKPAATRRALWAVEFGLRTIGSGLVGALLRPWGLGIAVLILIYLGWNQLADLLKPK